MLRFARFAAAALAATLIAGAAGSAHAERGTWRFHDDTRPIKAVVVGGSVTAWPRGNFGHFLEAACPRVEIALKGKARLGSSALAERVKDQVVRNRNVKVADYEAAWLIFQSGLNSIGTPELVNRDQAAVFQMAHDHGMKVLALTVGPWGAERDARRWAWTAGLAYRAFTARTVDFVLGRLTPEEALGRYAKERPAPGWTDGERPDVAVDLYYDSPLRDREAPLRDEAKARRYVLRDPAIKRELKALFDDAAREARVAELVAQVRELPRWFMKGELHSFDHIHPNMEGHRLMAEAICPKLPAAWGCDCGAIASMEWLKQGGGVGPKVQLSAAAPAGEGEAVPN
ncbi:MAG: hypothetical protein EP329_04580 [Deltaproteobacteria bacterium]|nr:MAG: hypothetical protein EP329_04580 [Deltaproteobacteria bacterium]